MANEVLNKFIDRLTSNYNKEPDSNVNKLMQIAAKHIQENENVLNTIGNWRDVDQAQGKALDKIGGNVQQRRGQMPDATYRVLIKSKIKRNLSNGSINTLVDFLSFILNCQSNEIKITELWSDANEPRPGVIGVEAPASNVHATGLSHNQFGTLLNLVLAAGIRADVLFEGTFGFSTQLNTVEVDTSGTHGFADSAQTKGGKLGAFFDPGNDYELPI